MKVEQPDPFSYSFIDLLSCALGGMVLLLITTTGKGDAYSDIDNYLHIQVTQPRLGAFDHLAFVEIDDLLLRVGNEVGIRDAQQIPNVGSYLSGQLQGATTSSAGGSSSIFARGLRAVLSDTPGQGFSSVQLEYANGASPPRVMWPSTVFDSAKPSELAAFSQMLAERYGVSIVLASASIASDGISIDASNLSRPVRMQIGFTLCTASASEHTVEVRYQSSLRNEKRAKLASSVFDLSPTSVQLWSGNGRVRVEDPASAQNGRVLGQDDVFHTIVVELSPNRVPLISTFSDVL